MKRIWCLLLLAVSVFVVNSPARAALADSSARTIRGEALDGQTDAILKQVGQAWMKREWDDYKARFTTPDGRVVDNANGGVSHSEGQGYGMLLATIANDQKGFETIWGWTEKNLYVRPDGLAAWRWDPKKNAVADQNNATDGDLLIAWALTRAAVAFNTPRYDEQAKTIGQAIGRTLVLQTNSGPILLPGAFGFKTTDQPDGPIVNLSYYVFPAFDALKRVTPDVPWDDIAATGYRLIETSRFGPLRLPSDWVSLASAAPSPAKNFAKTFGYDAIRIPLYLAWVGRLDGHTTRFAGLWNAKLDLGPFVTDINSGAAVRPIEGTGFKMVAALSACVAGKGPIPQALTSRRDDFYYPATLRLLCLAVVEERYARCL